MWPTDTALKLLQLIRLVMLELESKPSADSPMEAERASSGGFRQSEIESEIATACNHALAILLQIAQLNLQCAPTGWLRTTIVIS